MKDLEEVLWSLDREGIVEVTLMTDEPPYATVGTKLEPIDDDVWSTDQLLSGLVSFGGSRHVEELSDTPRQWTARIAGLGVISVAVTQTSDRVQARFRIARRETKSMAPHPSAPPNPRASVPSFPPAGNALLPPRAPSPSTHPTPQPRPVTPAPPPRQPSVAPPSAHSRATAPPPASPPRPPPRAAVGSLPAPPPLPPQALRAPTASSPAMQAPDIRRPTPTPTRVRPGLGEPIVDGHASRPPLAEAKGGPSAPPARTAPPPPFRPAPSAPAPSPSAPPLRRIDTATAPIRVSKRLTLVPPPERASLEQLFASARTSNASDLHLVAGRPPSVRVRGALYANGSPIDAARLEELVTPIIPERLLAVLADRGACRFAVEQEREGRYRVDVARQRTGIQVSVRVRPPVLPPFESLPLPAAVPAAARARHGLLVFSGPRGSGVTTTLHSFVDLVNRTRPHHVVLVEDPIEQIHGKRAGLVTQREIGAHATSFEAAVRAALRTDADVLALGEVPDEQTFVQALRASAEGRLVAIALRAPSARRATDRLIELMPRRERGSLLALLLAELRFITSQELHPADSGEGMHPTFDVLTAHIALARETEGTEG